MALWILTLVLTNQNYKKNPLCISSTEAVVENGGAKHSTHHSSQGQCKTHSIEQ